MVLTYREALQVALLLLCVPAQYFLSSNIRSDHSAALSRILVADLQYIKDHWLSSEAWSKTVFEMAQWFIKGALQPESTPNVMYGTIGMNENPAYEVLRFRQNRGYFTTSVAPRERRPPHVSYRVGQVVRHRAEGYTGVIIGWDVRARAPESWLAREYGDLGALRSWPHYAVLVDERDPISTALMAPEATYVVQQELELMHNTKVQHHQISNYFSAYDGSQYIAHEWLQILYPKD